MAPDSDQDVFVGSFKCTVFRNRGDILFSKRSAMITYAHMFSGLGFSKIQECVCSLKVRHTMFLRNTVGSRCGRANATDQRSPGRFRAVV